MERLYNSIDLIYVTEFQQYPSCIEYLIKLSDVISQEEAYNILMIYPKFTNKPQDDIENRCKIIKYNYTWTLVLLNKYVDINLIKQLLYEFLDYYYLELLYINQHYNNFNVSFEFMKKNLNNELNNSYTYMSHYYIMRTAGISHLNSYKWSRNTSSTIINIVELTKHNYNEFNFISTARALTKEQMDFLKLSRLAYTDVATFNQYKLNIFNNALNMGLINLEPFNDIDIFSENIQEMMKTEYTEIN